VLDIDRLTLRPAVDIASIVRAVVPPPLDELRFTIRRPDDLLVATLVTRNMALATGAPPRLMRKDAGDTYLLLVLPPQSFGEQAFLDSTGTESSEKEVAPDPYPKKNSPTPNQPAEAIGALPAARMRMSGPSRIAVTMPANVTTLGLTFAAVLEAARTWPLRLDINAAPEPRLGRGTLGDALATDKAWLAAVVAAPTWKTTAASLNEALARAGGATLARSISASANAIAQRAAATVAPEIGRLMNAELDRLATQFPALRERAQRETAYAALSLAAAESLASTPASVQIRPELFVDLPFLLVSFAPHEPLPSVTALELPYRLVTSPIEPARFTHADVPVTRGTRTELWHTRLTSAPGPGPDAPTKIRALWSQDYPIEDVLPLLLDPVKPYRMSLDPLDRKMLVKLMAGFNEKTIENKSYTPRASRSQRLMLSALGGLLDAEGNWSRRPALVGLEQWRHLATLGRDQYVRVVYAGFLVPFRHAASLIKVTERKFETLTAGNKSGRVAVLRQRFFIVVRERVKQYSGAGHAFAGRNFPFGSVEILTRVTPNLQPPEKCMVVEVAGKPIYDANVPPRAAFWPMVTLTADFRFEIAVTDLCGHRTSFAMPLLFVGEEANQSKAANSIAAYNATAASPRRLAPTKGSSVCYAPLKADAVGDPRLPTQSITFAAAGVTGVSLLEAQFYPEIEAADVALRPIQRLLGKDAPVSVKYPDIYKTQGFQAGNPGEVFLQTLQDYALEFGEGANQAKTDALGALASPAAAIQGLSRIMGPAADLGQVTSNKFDPAAFFKDAKILGGIPLASLLETVPALAGGNVPKMLSKELPDRVEASFTWNTEVNKSDPLGLFVPRADPSKPTKLDMRGVVSAPIGNPAGTTYEATAQLDNFKVNLFGFIIIWFDLLKFSAKQGSKPDVICELHPGNETILFSGPLEFVNELRNLIPSNGFSDPPNISVTPSGINASFSLNLPSVQVGVFTLSNASLGAGFALPFDSKPLTLRFNFCERQAPFNLTVSLLGGGGFFAIGIGTEGVREIEAALEFGAAVAIDLGVASGGVEIKAGVYFHWLQVNPSEGTVELAGYVRLHGELTVIGLISASLTFNLQLAYLKDQAAQKSTVWGEATLVIEVEVLLVSVDVSIKCRREFAGSKSDPKFLDFIPTQGVWDEYCGAFAVEA
jgi:hypothetical protein